MMYTYQHASSMAGMVCGYDGQGMQRVPAIGKTPMAGDLMMHTHQYLLRALRGGGDSVIDGSEANAGMEHKTQILISSVRTGAEDAGMAAC